MDGFRNENKPQIKEFKDFYKFIISQYTVDTFKVDTVFLINILISIFINFYT